MIKIRKAKEDDYNSALNLIKQLDSVVPEGTRDLWVALDNSQIVGVAKLEDFGEYIFLSFVGVGVSHQKRGIARLLLEKLLQDKQKDVYLYTIIPEFFEKFGFKITAPNPNLPSKKNLGCENCEPRKCVCMVKKYSQKDISQDKKHS